MRFKFYKEITSQTRKLLYELKNFSPVNFANNTPIKTTQIIPTGITKKDLYLIKKRKVTRVSFPSIFVNFLNVKSFIKKKKHITQYERCRTIIRRMNPPLAVNKYVKMESDIICCFVKRFSGKLQKCTPQSLGIQ